MTHNCVLLFVRYPTPGQTKTRLIPALGAVGAAQLQWEMAQYLVRRLNRPDEWTLQVCFTGGMRGQSPSVGRSQMQAWLGDGLSYQPQAAGDLGDRLWHGFSHLSVTDVSNLSDNRVVAIGADCPDVSAAHIQQAFEELSHNDVVLGPAQDGGYYLIGLKNLRDGCQIDPRKILFQGIDWSTSRVLQQTWDKARRMGWAIACLEQLADIDRPEDLVLWEQMQVLAR